jgi:hypothetical protein
MRRVCTRFLHILQTFPDSNHTLSLGKSAMKAAWSTNDATPFMSDVFARVFLYRDLYRNKECFEPFDMALPLRIDCVSRNGTIRQAY